MVSRAYGDYGRRLVMAAGHRLTIDFGQHLSSVATSALSHIRLRLATSNSSSIQLYPCEVFSVEMPATYRAQKTPPSLVSIVKLAPFGTTTPRIFRIPEICREICEFVALYEDFDKPTCRALASTCRDLYGPALEVVWYESRNFKGLVNYFRRDGAVNGVIKAEFCTAHGQLEDTESKLKWAWTDRSMAILRHIRSLYIDPCMDANVLRMLVDHTSHTGKPLMPHLKELTWDQTPPLGQLSDTHVNELRADLFRLFHAHSAKLQEVEFLHRDGSPDLALTFDVVLPDVYWPALNTLMTDFAMTTAALTALGKSKTLVELCCSVSVAQLAVLNKDEEAKFSALRHLSIDIQGNFDVADWMTLHQFLNLQRRS